MRGKQITSLHDIYVLALQKRAVYTPDSPRCPKPKPAAFVIRMTGFMILYLLNAGLYVYEKGRKQ